MKITEIIDKYNADKVWVIKKYSCGHYYINQKINNRIFYKAFQKTTKSYIESVLDRRI